MRFVLYQPDIPQNTGAIMRLAACLGMGVDIIEPCGFVLDDKRLRRAAMDYIDVLDWQRWPSWDTYCGQAHPGRLILLTTKGTVDHLALNYRPDDRLVLGQESAGVPESVHDVADLRAAIAVRPGMRSLNVAIAAAMVATEAIRQTGSPWQGPSGA